MQELKALAVNLKQPNSTVPQAIFGLEEQTHLSCHYCGFKSLVPARSAANRVSLFYVWQTPTPAKSPKRQVNLACSFCTQCLHIDSYGRDHGVLYLLPEFSQAQLIRACWSAFQILASVDRRGLCSSDHTLANDFVHRLNQRGARAWHRLKGRNTAACEIHDFVRAARSFPNLDQVHASSKTALRYVPKFDQHNRAAIAWFEQLQHKYPERDKHDR